MTAILEIENVRFARGERTILSGVDLSLGRGERVAILGENGAGKTTLLRLIAAMEVPDEGGIRRLGRVAWIPQAYAESLFPWFSVLRNVAMPRMIARMRDAKAVAERLCTRVLPRVSPQASAGALSGGEQQATAIARALAWPTDVILADEPLSSIDAAAKPFILRAIEDELGDRALLLVTHDRADAALCQRVLVLDAGRLAAA